MGNRYEREREKGWFDVVMQDGVAEGLFWLLRGVGILTIRLFQIIMELFHHM